MENKINFNTYTHDFGIIIPKETHVNFVHQDGGMSCAQTELEGVFYPIDNPKIHLGYPEWKDLEDEISKIDLTREEIPERDFNSFPEWVQERGYFYNYDEYFYWLNQDNVDWYGYIDLNREQRLWNYDPEGKLHINYLGYNPTEKWDSLEEIWCYIDESLPFVYEEFNAWEYKKEQSKKENISYENMELPIPEDYKEYGSSFKWIKILGSKEDEKGRKKAEWAEKLKGEYVILTYSNCD